MGLADLSISEIATDSPLSQEAVTSLCDRVGIAYKTSHTHLALKDAKAVVLEISAHRSSGNSPASESALSLCLPPWKLLRLDALIDLC